MGGAYWHRSTSVDLACVIPIERLDPRLAFASWVGWGFWHIYLPTSHICPPLVHLRRIVTMSSPNSPDLQRLRQLVNQIHKDCSKIPVAKVNLPSSSILSALITRSPKQKMSSQLMDLSNDLIKRLSDRSVIPQQSSYEDIIRRACCLSSSYIALT